MLSLDERIAELFSKVEHRRADMHGYQIKAQEFLRSNPFSGLFIDMGMGKTVTTGSVCVDLLDEWQFEGKMLIIAPLKVATDTWPTEFEVWEHLAHHKPVLIREQDDDPRIIEARATARAKSRADAVDLGCDSAQTSRMVEKSAQMAEMAMRRKIRRELALGPGSIHIINRENVEWLVELYGSKWPYRTVIIDESSSFKDHKTNRFKALAWVRRHPKNLITRLHILTATPAAESYENLFAQIYLLDLGQRLGKNITRYRERYFTFNPWARKYKIRDGADKEITALISDITLVMRAEDYLSVKKPTIVPRRIRLDDAQVEMYERLERDFVVDLPDGRTLEAETAAALSQKLLQLASGVLYETYREEDADTGDLKKVKRVHHIHDHKIEALRQIVEELDGKSVLVAYHFQSSLHRLQKAFPKAVLMDREGKCIKAWNKGSIPMLFVHPQSAGHGLNLQRGGHNIVFFDIPWSFENFFQTVGRLARQGQKFQVLVQMLVASGTLDEAVYSALTAKGDQQEQFFRLLKEMIQRLRRATARALRP